MTFIVFDQGYRTETPWYDLFPAKKVNATQAASALHSPTLNLEQEELEWGAPKQESQEKEPYTKPQPQQQTASPSHPQPTAARQRIGCAADIMSQPVIYASEDESIQTASEQFKQYGVHHLPVLDVHGKLVGLISDRDLLRHQAAQPNAGHRLAPQALKNIMTRRVLTALPHTGIPQLAEVMVRHRIGALPIVAPEGQLHGMITRLDILRAIMTEAPIELWA